MTSLTETKPGSLERAIEIAARAHHGHADKAGEQYILHALRVMMQCESADAKIVAVLHDVVEDAPDWTLERLRDEGFSEKVIRGVESLTKRPDEKGSEDGYFAFCDRAAEDPLGREVKRADLRDNMNVMRLKPELTESDLERLRRYRTAYERLSEKTFTATLHTDPGEESRDVWVSAGPKGLCIYTQDFGENVRAFWGRDEYEFWTTVPRENWDQLLVALCREFLSVPHASRTLQSICSNHGVPSKSGSWP